MVSYDTVYNDLQKAINIKYKEIELIGQSNAGKYWKGKSYKHFYKAIYNYINDNRKTITIPLEKLSYACQEYHYYLQCNDEATKKAKMQKIVGFLDGALECEDSPDVAKKTY